MSNLQSAREGISSSHLIALVLDSLLEFLCCSQSGLGSCTPRPTAPHCLEDQDAAKKEGGDIDVFRITDIVRSFTCSVLQALTEGRVLAATILQLIYLNRAAHTSDATFKAWPVVLGAQMVQSLSIITACIPSLKPFLESLESGMLRSDDLRRRGMGGVYGYGSHNLTNLSTSRSTGKKEKPHLTSNPSAGKHYKLPNNISTVVSMNRNEDPERDSDSQGSASRIIKYTRTFSVE